LSKSIIYLIVLYATNCFAFSNVDSLQKLLETEKKPVRLIDINLELFNKIDTPNQSTDSSINFLFQALKIAKDNSFRDKKINILMKIGNAYRNKAEYAKALEYLFVAKKQAEDFVLKKDYASILNSIGVVYRRLDDFDKATMYHLSALEEAEGLDDEKNKEVALNSLGNVFNLMGQYTKAEEYFLTALDLAIKKNNKLGMAINYNNLGELFVATKNFNKARDYFDLSLELNQELNNEKGIAICFNCLGIVYKNLEDYEKALKFYLKALEIDIRAKDKSFLAQTYIHLSDIYYLTNKLDFAEENILEAIKISLAISSKQKAQEAYSLLAKIYEKQDDYETAYYYQAVSGMYRDSVLNEKNSRNIAHLQILFEDKQKEKEIESLTLENELQERNTMLLASVVFAILFLLVIILFRYKQKQKHNIELARMNDTISNANIELETLNEQLVGQNSIILKQRDELEQANLSKDLLFSIIGHDLKNPVANMMITSELIITHFDKFSKTELIDYVEKINKSGQLTINLLKNLLDWARSQTGGIEVEFEDIKLSDFIVETTNVLVNQALNKNIALEYNINEEIVVYADKNLLETVIRNLVSNAIKFTQKNGLITISSAIDFDGKTVISVKDNGIGIPPEKLASIFEPQKNKSTKGTMKEPGTGLGLMLCKEFIDKLDAKIEARSQVGNGTEFIITFN